MYIPSDKYKQASSKVSRIPKSKIVINDIEYTGRDVIKTSPIIKHEAIKMIGEFPTRECKITIFNRNENSPINVLEKDIQVFKGLILEDGTTEYIPQGVFRPKAPDVKTNSTAKTIEITMKDNSVVFDNKYEGNQEYPCTLGEFINEIITRRGFIFETPKFPFYDLILNERPNFDLESTVERYLIAAAAEIGGCTVQMSRTGGVQITKPVSTNLIIKKTEYKRLPSKEKQFGPINSVILGNNNMNNDIIYRDEDSIVKNGLFEWKILDNPYVDKIKKEMIDKVAEKIIGMSIIPFELQDVIDNYLYDLNDVITIEDKFGNLFNTTILSLESTSRIFTKAKAAVQNDTMTNYNLAGSSKKSIERIKLDVDHVKNEMNLVAEKVTDNNKKIAEMNVDINSISLRTAEVEEEIMQATQSIDEINPIVSTSSSKLILNDSAGKDLIDFSLLGKSYQQVTEVNRNICPSQFQYWESGDYFMVDGSKVAENNRIRLKELVKVESNQTYYVNTFSNNIAKFIFRTFDKDKKFVRSIGAIDDNLKITMQENEAYIAISMYSTTLSTSIFYDDYKKYFENEQILPFICLDSESDKTFIEYVPNSPSPQYLKEIESISKDGKVSLSIHTKNLLNVSNQYTLTGVKEIIVNLQEGVYTVSWKNIKTDGTNNSILLYFHYDDDTTLAKYISQTYPSKSLTFTTTKKVVKIGVYSQSSWNESQGVTTTFEELMIEENDEKTDYVEYQQQTIEIDLKDNELHSLSNNLYDELNIKESNVCLTKKIAKKVFDGTENWLSNSRFVGDYISFYTEDGITDKKKEENSLSLCTHNKQHELAWNEKSECYMFTKNYFIFGIEKAKLDTADINGFKKWLKQQYDEDKAVTLYYELENEEIINLEECNISTTKDESYIELVDTLETTMSCKYYKNSYITDYFQTKTDTSAQIKIASDSILNEVSQTNQNLADITTETNNIKLELDKVTQNYEKVGGSNKIHDSVGRFNSKEYWENSAEGEFVQGYDQSLIGKTESSSKISIRNGTKKTTLSNIVDIITNKKITLSYKLTNEANTTTIVRIIGNTILYENKVTEVTELKEFEFSFIPNTTSLILEIISNTTQFGWSHISDLMLGDSKTWEQAQGETWSRVIEVNEFGQLIKSPNVNTAYFTGMEGMGLYELNNDKLGERKSKFDISGLSTTKVECTEIKQDGLVHTNIDLNGQKMYVSYIEEGAYK